LKCHSRPFEHFFFWLESRRQSGYPFPPTRPLRYVTSSRDLPPLGVSYTKRAKLHPVFFNATSLLDLFLLPFFLRVALFQRTDPPIRPSLPPVDAIGQFLVTCSFPPHLSLWSGMTSNLSGYPNIVFTPAQGRF